MINDMSGYIYKTTNNITGDFYIGKRYNYRDVGLREVYLGSGVRLNEQIKQYGRENFTKEILCSCNNNEELFEQEKKYYYKYVKDPHFLNYENGIGYGGIYYTGKCSICNEEKVLYHLDENFNGICMSCLKKNIETKYYCDSCERETYHYKNGKCKGCVARENNMKKFCNVCQKETIHNGETCRSHNIRLKKTEDGRVEVYISHTNKKSWKLLLNDISLINDIKQYKTPISTAYYLPHDMVKIKCNNEYTSLNTLLYNNAITDWLKITYTIKDLDSSITVTTDHPLPLSNGEVKFAKDLKIGDELIAIKGNDIVAKIINIEHVEQCCRSYDVSTDTEYFDLNHILSHNCRSFLSPWYERGGFTPEDENDVPRYLGRGNCGVVSLNLPMIYMKAKQQCEDFYEVLDYYLELIRNLHKRTIEYLGEMKASINPLAYCEGGFYGGNLKPDDKIKPVLKTFTTSFGITALQELQELYNQKSLVQDGTFALAVLQYIANKVEQFKKEDGILHSVYGSPAESLCKTQVDQFRMKYGIIENVSDKDFMTNSFHCHVSEDITPIQKQDLEGRFIDLCKGGQIYFTRFNCNYNTEAFKTIVRRGMRKGFYEGTNLNLSYCEDCGHEELDMDKCPICGSDNITSINRVCGYLGYSRIKGDTRFNQGKMAEVKERVSY